MKMNKILAAGAAAVVLAGFSGCSKKGGAPAAEEKVETVFAVNAYKTVPRTLDDYLYLEYKSTSLPLSHIQFHCSH